MTRRPPFLVAASLFALFAAVEARSAGGASQLTGTFVNRLAHPAIEYASRPTSDPVSELNRKLAVGSIRLKSDGPSGYLQSMLQALNVPIESQIAVFRPDSVQSPLISLRSPRTLFFNDSVAVGWVRGGFIELASQDPEQGVIFYSLDRLLVGYVTGRTGSRHMGKSDAGRLFEGPRPTDTFNWPSLAGRFDTGAYLSAYSDIAALMVFEHQMHMMNLLGRIGWDARNRRIKRLHASGLSIAAGEQRGGHGLQAASGFFVQAIGVATNGFEVAERVNDGLANRAQDRIVGFRQTIVDPQALAASVDEPGPAQIRQMPRGFRLGNPEALLHVAHADFSGEQQAENPEPRGIGERLEENLHRRQLSVHIYGLTNISRHGYPAYTFTHIYEVRHA